MPTTANAGSTISLNASATDGSGNTVTSTSSAYQWTIYYNNAVYAQETGGNPSLKLGDPGTYKVVMNEGSVSKTSTIQVADVPPTVSSLNLQTGYADGQSVTLAPSVYSPLPEAPGGLNYQWTILKRRPAVRDRQHPDLHVHAGRAERGPRRVLRFQTSTRSA